MKRKVSGIVMLIVITFVITSTTSAVAGGNKKPKGSWIPEEYVKYCEDIGYKYHVSPELLEAIIEHESAGQRRAYNSAYSCTGLMQINPSAHRDRMRRLGVTDLYNAKQNITVGADYLLELFRICEGDVYWVLMRYHGERHAKDKALSGNYSSYARSIVDRAYDLEEAHGKHNY